MYKRIFTSSTVELIYRDWYKVNRGGTLRQFRKYLEVLNECLEVRGVKC